MAQSLASILIHLVFSTKNRERILAPEIQPKLHAYIVGILNGTGCAPLQTGGTDDHVHIFFGLSRTLALADAVKTIKANSATWLREQHLAFHNFHWQAGYGAFSVSESNADTVKNYIKNQEEHHRKMTFQDEFRALLNRYKIPHDEKYVWD